MAKVHADRARSLVGIPFRPQGRNPEVGLDCVGLAMHAYGLAPGQVRDDYRLRGDHMAEIVAALAGCFRKVSRTQAKPGDLMLLRISDAQFHLAVRTDKGFVHADAGLRRVVETPSEPSWLLVGVYRRRRANRVRGG